MKKYALDTNILSYLLKGNELISDKIEKEKNNRNTFVIPPIVYYEINNWLLRNNSKSKAAIFKKIYSVNGIGANSKEVLDTASSIYNDQGATELLVECNDYYILYSYCPAVTL